MPRQAPYLARRLRIPSLDTQSFSTFQRTVPNREKEVRPPAFPALLHPLFSRLPTPAPCPVRFRFRTAPRRWSGVISINPNQRNTFFPIS